MKRAMANPPPEAAHRAETADCSECDRCARQLGSRYLMRCAGCDKAACRQCLGMSVQLWARCRLGGPPACPPADSTGGWRCVECKTCDECGSRTPPSGRTDGGVFFCNWCDGAVHAECVDLETPRAGSDELWKCGRCCNDGFRIKVAKVGLTAKLTNQFYRHQTHTPSMLEIYMKSFD